MFLLNGNAEIFKIPYNHAISKTDFTMKQLPISCTNFCNGKQHDFKLFKESKVRFKAATETLVDSGYQGIQKLHAVRFGKKSIF